jgi:hypothetical protein
VAWSCHASRAHQHDRRPGAAGAARRVAGHVNDASLVDAALDALIAANRRVELDASYAAYDETPVEAPDEWGDLASFRSAAASS